MIKIPASIWHLINISVQAAITRGMLLAQRGATEEEIRAHIKLMEAQNEAANVELDRLRKENP